MTGPALLLHRTSVRPRAAVLVLHGGQVKGVRPARSWQLAALRMDPVVRSLAGELADDVLVARVRYRVRGWNGTDADPVHDTRRALDELAALAGPVPTVLVGHSMGGRAALHAAGHPLVHAVVGLAPWWPRGEPVEQTAGRRLLALHGDRDHVTSPADTADLVRRARDVAAHADLTLVTGGDHAMLRHHRLWHRETARAVTGLLAPEGTPT
ncbi:alpha/beta fold hydrolase [Streptomyces roseirectus]|uniref:Alpha/beta fold hydrolase n=1 Tax=Streptomyces roseirectus TaxID=2768066 RepID=A0A7H0IRZ5_9ACTN|nr:alpha/beta fold hydrolase [Streptomyces roseirectus]